MLLALFRKIHFIMLLIPGMVSCGHRQSVLIEHSAAVVFSISQ